MANPIDILVRFLGGAEASRGIDNVSNRVENLSAQQTAAATSAIVFGQRLAAAANAIQGLTSALGIESETAGLIGRITQTSTAMAQLGQTFGPQGALVGGILGAAIPAIQALSQQMHAQEEVIRQLRENADNLVESYDEILSRINRVNSERARESRVSMGLGTSAEQQAFVEQRQQEETAARMRVEAALMELNNASMSEMATATQNLRAAEQAQREAAQRITQAQEAQRMAAADAAGDAERMMEELMSAGEQTQTQARRGGGRARAEEERAPSGPSEAERMYAETLAEENAYLQQQADLEEYLSDLRQREITEIDGREERVKKQHDAEMERLEERQDRLNEVQARQREAHEQQVEEYKGLMGVVVGGLNDALQSIIAGQKTAGEAFEGLLASFLKYISEQAILKAIFEYAEAIASFASYKIDQGVQHLAAGAAYTAVAVAAGAGSVALSAPSGATPSDQKPAGPEAGAAGEGRGGGDVVINWNSPVVTAGTRAELGRDMASMIRAGSQRFGTV